MRLSDGTEARLQDLRSPPRHIGTFEEFVSVFGEPDSQQQATTAEVVRHFFEQDPPQRLLINLPPRALHKGTRLRTRTRGGKP